MLDQKLKPWICTGTIRKGGLRGHPCRKPLMEIHVQGEGFVTIRKTCERCGTVYTTTFGGGFHHEP